eukprot:scaffold71100_cov39-Tisochrysis_lutea.AAC.1
MEGCEYHDTRLLRARLPSLLSPSVSPSPSLLPHSACCSLSLTLLLLKPPPMGLAKLLRMLLPIGFLLMQSPLAYKAAGAPLVPLQVLARYVYEETAGKPQAEHVAIGLRAVLFPGNVVRAALCAAPLNRTEGAPSLDVKEVWERSIQLGTRNAYTLKSSTEQQQLLLVGCACSILGALLSLLLFRVHVLLLLGVTVLGVFFGLNGLTATVQYALCVMLPVYEMSKAAAATTATPTTTTTKKIPLSANKAGKKA